MANKDIVSQPKKTISTKSVNPSAIPRKNFFLRHSILLLTLAVIIVYFPSLRLGYTELDDSIFIKEQKAYNEDLSNLITSFKRGVFNPTKDVYYRPLLLDSFILNYHLSHENILGWHVVNVLLHLFSVILLLLLLKKIGINELSSFLLSLLFAVHPVLSQAVAWIPGRNDTMLAIFVFSYLLTALKYSETKKFSLLSLQCLLLLASLFTKETAVFAAPAAWMMQSIGVED